VEIVELPPVNGMLDRQSLAGKLDDRCAAVMVQNPNFFGCVADYGDLAVQVIAQLGVEIPLGIAAAREAVPEAHDSSPSWLRISPTASVSRCQLAVSDSSSARPRAVSR